MRICENGLSFLAMVLAVCLGSSTFAASITWDAGGDGASTFQEANWVVTDETGTPALSGLLGSNPPAGFVDGAVDVLADAIVGGTATAGGGAGAGNHFDLGDGFDLTVEDDATFRMQLGSFGGGPRGIRGVAGGAVENLIIEDTADVFSQFLLNISASMSGSSNLTLGGGGAGTLNNSTMALAADWTGSITWPNYAGVSGNASFLSQFTVGGSPAVEGTNVLVVSDGGSGSILTVIPEPASIVLMMTGLACCVVRRRDS